MIRKRKDTRLLKVNIGRWGTPVAKQFGIKAIPQLRYYEGKALKSQDTGQIIGRLAR